MLKRKKLLTQDGLVKLCKMEWVIKAMSRVNLMILREAAAMFQFSLAYLASQANLENLLNQGKVAQKVQKVIQKKK